MKISNGVDRVGSPDQNPAEGRDHDHSLSVRFSATAQKIKRIALNAISFIADVTAYLKGDVFSLGRVLTLAGHTITVVNDFCGVHPDCLGLLGKFKITKKMMSMFLIGYPISYYLRGKNHKDYSKENFHCLGKDWQKGNYFSLIGNGAFGLGSVGIILSVFNDVGLISLSEFSTALGKIPVLKIVTLAGVGFKAALTASFFIGFACLFVDTCKDYRKMPNETEQNQSDKKKARWEAAWLVSEMVSQLASLCRATTPVMIFLESVAAGLGTYSFLSGKPQSNN